MDRVKVYKDRTGEWRWTRTAENGNIIAGSGEGYEHRGHALHMASKLNPDCIVSVDHGVVSKTPTSEPDAD